MTKWLATPQVVHVREILRSKYPQGFESLDRLLQHLDRQPDYRFQHDLTHLPHVREALAKMKGWVDSGVLPAGVELSFHPVAMRRKSGSGQAMIDTPPLAFVMLKRDPGLPDGYVGTLFNANVIWRSGDLFITRKMLEEYRQSHPDLSEGE
jgi:hypothetical protein